jgi:hypothetical protein
MTEQQDPAMLHQLLGATNTQVRWWGRAAYAISLSLLIGVAFYQGMLGSRVAEVERLYKERVTMTEQRYAEDHAMLMTINSAKEQRTAILGEIDRRISRLESALMAGPQ